MQNQNFLISELKKASEIIGNDKNLIQGNGGNISIKINGELWVKASGKMLKNAQNQEVFVGLNLSQILSNFSKLKTNSPLNALYQNIEIKNAHLDLRPSIETIFHAIIKQNCVFHLHSINTMRISICKNAQELLRKIFHEDDKICFIKYCRPGIALGKKIAKEIKKNPNAEIFILQNHGLIMCGDTPNETLKKLYEIERKLFDAFPFFIDDTNLDKIPQFEKYEHAFDNIKNTWALKQIANNAFFPDQIIFIGDKIPYFNNENQIKEYLKTNQPKVFALKDFGFYLHENANDEIKEMIFALVKIFQGLGKEQVLKKISKNEIEFLSNWDAEKYRKSQLK